MIQKLCESGVADIATVAHLAQDEPGMIAYFKAVFEIDAEVRPADFVPRAKLLVAWTASRAFM